MAGMVITHAYAGAVIVTGPFCIAVSRADQMPAVIGAPERHLADWLRGPVRYPVHPIANLVEVVEDHAPGLTHPQSVAWPAVGAFRVRLRHIGAANEGWPRP